MWNSILLPAVLASLAIAAPTATLHKRDTDTDSSRCPNFCGGTKSANESNATSLYICGDKRLGPIVLPTALPLSAIAGDSSSYHRFGGLCPGEFLATYTNDGSYTYPHYDGFALSTDGEPMEANMTLQPGTMVDRFGAEYGRYMSPAGAPYAQRALPPSNLNAAPGDAYPYNYRVYEVLRPFVVLAGPIAPWFKQMGMGVQYKLDDSTSVAKLVAQGYLGRIDLKGYPNY